MRRPIIFLILIFMSLFNFGCDKPEEKVISSLVSPDKKHTIWVTIAYGGINSDVVRAYVTKTGVEFSIKDIFFRTSDCTNTNILWIDRENIAIKYDYITISSFYSNIKDLKLQVKLIKNNDIAKKNEEYIKTVNIPCTIWGKY